MRYYIVIDNYIIIRIKEKYFKYYILIMINYFNFLVLDYSNGGKYMVLVERRDCKDFVIIFVCDFWEFVKVI